MLPVRVLRPAVLLALALGIAGCNGSGGSTLKSPKHLQPLSAETYRTLEKNGMRKEDPILVRIYKEESTLEVWKKRQQDGRYALFKSYDICRWSGKLGPKIKEGDRQAPEGFYAINPGLMNPKSSYYLSFNMGFPNAYDRAYGRTGLHLMVHGACSSAGCYSMTDAQIGEIYALAREAFAAGQESFQVQALPFRMTADNLARHRNNPNMSFWKNLKEGTDSFEVTRHEPKVDVCGKRYLFNAASTDASGLFEASAPCPAYEVPPEIATAVAAKARADDVRVAALSTPDSPLAPLDSMQGGPTVAPPVVAVAAVEPAKPAAPVAGGAVPLPTPKSTALAYAPKPAGPASGVQVAAVDGGESAGEPSMFGRWLGFEISDVAKKLEEQTGSVTKPAPQVVAPAPAPAARPVVTPSAPVAASAAKAVRAPSVAKLPQSTGVEARAGSPPAEAKPLSQHVLPSSQASSSEPAPIAQAPAGQAPVPAPDVKAAPRVNSAFSVFN